MGKYGECWSDDGKYERVCIEIIDSYYHKNYRSLTEIYHLINELNDYAVELIKENEQLRQQSEQYRKSRDKWRTKAQKVDYWKHKSLELYKLLRSINLSDKEWEQFLNIINEKELFDDE